MKKVITIIVSALAFGVIAAAAFIGVNIFANQSGLMPQQIISNNNTVIEKNTTESTIAPPEFVTETKPRTITKKNSGVYEDVPSLVEDSMASVVAITNMQKFRDNGFSIFGYRQQAREYEVPASGSGVIVGINDSEVIILTNNHVVSSSASLDVTFNDGSEAVKASIKGTDASKDLAIISVAKSDMKADTIDKVKAIAIGNSDDILVGEAVVAIGNALGIGQSVTTGVVSAKDRIVDGINETEKLIQTDTAINPGNSGGALLNMKGELIGINVAKTSGNAIEGMGYAIPVNTAKTVIETMSNRKARETIPEEEQGYLGIQAKNIDSQTANSLDMPEGIYVFKITENSAAAKSDLKEKDIIISFDEQNVKTLSELQDLLKYTKAGQEVKMKVKRLNGGVYEEIEFSLTLGNRPKDENKTETTTKAANDNGVQGSDNNGNNNNNGGQYGYSGEYDPFSGLDDIFRGFGFRMW